MSHGGFGGGGGHSGFGHSGGYAHGGHGAGMGHGAGVSGGHGGTIIGHVLHSLGLAGGHGQHHHGVGASHHPDQSPNWNQAMQTQKRSFIRVDRTPFVMLFLMVTMSFFWLWVIYSIHHHESAKDSAATSSSAPSSSIPASIAPASSTASDNQFQAPEAAQMPQAAPAPQAPAQFAYPQTAMKPAYGYSYLQAARQGGFGQAQAMSGTAYGGMQAGNPATVQLAPTEFGSPATTMDPYANPGRPNDYRSSQLANLTRQATAPSPYAATAAGAGYATTPFQQNFYAPLNNGRARLVVAR